MKARQTICNLIHPEYQILCDMDRGGDAERPNQDYRQLVKLEVTPDEVYLPALTRQSSNMIGIVRLAIADSGPQARFSDGSLSRQCHVARCIRDRSTDCRRFS